MSERKRLLELAGLDAKRILSEVKVLWIQRQFDDDEEEIPEFMNLVKKYGLKIKYSGRARAKADEHFFHIEIPKQQSKLLAFMNKEMGLDKEDVDDEYPELDTGQYNRWQ